MWGRRKKRRGQLPRQLALGLLEDAMAQVQPPQEQQEDEPALTKYPSAEYGPPPPGTPARADLQAADVPVDNSAEPGLPDPKAQRQLPARRTGESTRHRSLVSMNHSRDRESAVDPQLIIRLMVLTGGKDSGARPTCLPRTHPTCLPRSHPKA
jgi:hypothetical protein